ncbi:unnamed protein product [Meloidogyne enterolobii]|uniref:Uncharacterized protein n=1 Tax=Meloidogyne enterolobii TaxID=390850 RepID=A0ACB0XQR6_MELEN
MYCKDFVKLKNKWSEFDNRYKCCDNKCINTSNPIGNCIEGNGFGNLISDENIKYVNCLKGSDEFVLICAENTFKKPQNCLNYSLFYFEIKRKIERNYGKWMNIGLQNGSTNKFVSYFARLSMIKNEKNEEFKLSQTLPWNEDDIFGCGLVYPSTNKLNEVFPYVFFTQNGKQIGKAILVMESNDLYSPYVLLKCCSIEANFGNDLENKPFKYDISEHLICDEFY